MSNLALGALGVHAYGAYAQAGSTISLADTQVTMSNGLDVSGAGSSLAGTNVDVAISHPDAPLLESYQDWVVVCAMQLQVSGQAAVRLCTMNQQKTQNQNGLAIELKHTDNGLEGILMLPFGLSLDKGVRLQVGDSMPSGSYRFRTCLPTGCIVPLSFDDAFATALQKGGFLRIQVTADGGQDPALAVSLKGFAAAQKRLAELSR